MYCSEVAVKPVDRLGGEPGDVEKSAFGADINAGDQSDQPVSFLKRMQKWAMHGVNVDIHKVVDEDPIVSQIHESAEKFDPHVEYVFAYLQVRTVL